MAEALELMVFHQDPLQDNQWKPWSITSVELPSYWANELRFAEKQMPIRIRTIKTRNRPNLFTNFTLSVFIYPENENKKRDILQKAMNHPRLRLLPINFIF